MTENKTISKFIENLKTNPKVIGILLYGSFVQNEQNKNSDLDVIVIVKDQPKCIEGLHFYLGDRPVDLSIRSLQDVQKLAAKRYYEEITSGDDFIFFDTKIIYDPFDILKRSQDRIQKINFKHKERTIGEIAWDRFAHTHLLNKFRDVRKAGPLYASILLNTNIWWLLQTYFRIRRIFWKGTKKALKYLEREDPGILNLIKDFYKTTNMEEKYEISRKLTNFALRPIGKIWEKREILFTGKCSECPEKSVCEDLLKKEGNKYWKELNLQIG